MTARCCVGFQWARSGPTHRRRVERFGAAPVSRPDVRTATDELPCHRGVVAERRRVERRVAFVDLGQALGHEELLVASQACRHQRRRCVEKRQSGLLIARRDRYDQLGQVAHARKVVSSAGATPPLKSARSIALVDTTVFRNVQVFDGSGTVPFTGSVTVVTTLFGFSPNEALVAATRHGGELLDLPVGQIRPGYLADLLLVDGVTPPPTSRSCKTGHG